MLDAANEISSSSQEITLCMTQFGTGSNILTDNVKENLRKNFAIIHNSIDTINANLPLSPAIGGFVNQIGTELNAVELIISRAEYIRHGALSNEDILNIKERCEKISSLSIQISQIAPPPPIPDDSHYSYNDPNI